jgi:hypothetical protein
MPQSVEQKYPLPYLGEEDSDVLRITVVIHSQQTPQLNLF